MLNLLDTRAIENARVKLTPLQNYDYLKVRDVTRVRAATHFRKLHSQQYMPLAKRMVSFEGVVIFMLSISGTSCKPFSIKMEFLSSQNSQIYTSL